MTYLQSGWCMVAKLRTIKCALKNTKYIYVDNEPDPSMIDILAQIIFIMARFQVCGTRYDAISCIHMNLKSLLVAVVHLALHFSKTVWTVVFLDSMDRCNLILVASSGVQSRSVSAVKEKKHKPVEEKSSQKIRCLKQREQLFSTYYRNSTYG